MVLRRGSLVRVREKFGNDGCYWSVEIEQTALVEDHRQRSRGNDFGEGSEVEESGGVDRRVPTSGKIGETWGTRCLFSCAIVWIVCEVAEGFEGYEFSGMGDGD